MWAPRKIEDPDLELLNLNWIVEHTDPETGETHVVTALRNIGKMVVSEATIMPIGLTRKAAMKLATLLNDTMFEQERKLLG